MAVPHICLFIPPMAACTATIGSISDSISDSSLFKLIQEAISLYRYDRGIVWEIYGN
ncbi:MAG: hypothetical protein J6Y69_09390 [Treponema sp.]|nr:hypothetical protein [Treponema sp.]